MQENKFRQRTSAQAQQVCASIDVTNANKRTHYPWNLFPLGALVFVAFPPVVFPSRRLIDDINPVAFPALSEALWPLW